MAVDLTALLQGNRLLLLAFVLFCIFGLVFLALNIHLISVGKRYKRLMRGVDGQNLETLLQESLKAHQDDEERISQLEASCCRLQEVTATTLQNVGFLRFNAFAEGGNELSFVLALLNHKADGVVLCCLMNRDDCRLYGKTVVGGTSTYTLSQEEREVISMAMHSDADHSATD